MNTYNTQKSDAPTMTAVTTEMTDDYKTYVYNLLTVAQSLSCDPALANRNRQELMKFRNSGFPAVDEYLKQLDAAAFAAILAAAPKPPVPFTSVEHQQHMVRDAMLHAI